MKKISELQTERRQLLKWMGGSVALLSIGGLTACSDGGSEPAAAPKKPSTPAEPQAQAKSAPKPPKAATPPAEQAADGMTPQAPEPAPQPSAPAASELPKLAEANPQAQALGYKNDTTTVDAARYPNHAADQACANCALFSGQAGQDWGPCGIFPGNQVNARGWCSAYNRKA